MWSRADDGFDADSHCVRCGCAIYFDVGMPGPCPQCGGDYEKTDKQLAEEEAHRAEESRKMETSEYWFDKMAKDLDNHIWGFDMMYGGMENLIPPDSKAKADAVTQALKDLRTRFFG